MPATDTVCWSPVSAATVPFAEMLAIAADNVPDPGRLDALSPSRAIGAAFPEIEVDDTVMIAELETELFVSNESSSLGGSVGVESLDEVDLEEGRPFSPWF